MQQPIDVTLHNFPPSCVPLANKKLSRNSSSLFLLHTLTHFTHLHAHPLIHTNTHTHLLTCGHTHTRTRTRSHAHTHTFMHTQAPAQTVSLSLSLSAFLRSIGNDVTQL